MAVFTSVSPAALADFLHSYDLGTVKELTGIARGTENTNYFLHTTTGKFILTLYEKRVRVEDLPKYLQILSHLGGQGFFCPRPVPAKNGEVIHQLCGRPAAIQTFLDGEEIVIPSVQNCSTLGGKAAELHAKLSTLTLNLPNRMNLPVWHTLIEEGLAPAEIKELLLDELLYLDQHWPADLPQGLIHGDLAPGNVFAVKGRISGMFDFYFSCEDFYAYELAICLNAWCFEKGVFQLEKARAMFAGYGAERALTVAEKEHFNTLARGAAVRIVATRLHDWTNTPAHAQVTKRDPQEYIDRLKFHQGIKDYKNYGLS